MSGHGKILRVGILRLRCQEPLRYFVGLQCFPTTGTPSGSNSGFSSIRPEQGARTEASEPSRTPSFSSSSFVLLLPLPLSSIAPEQPLLRLDLFAVPGLSDSGLLAGAAEAGGDPARVLVGSGLVGSGTLGEDTAARLLQGQRVTYTLALGEPAPEASLPAYEVLLELTLLDATPPEAATGAESSAVEAVDALVHECLAKQVTLGKVARQLDATAAQAEVVSWRLLDSEKRNRNLTEDKARLQELLQAEQQSWRIPQLRMLVDSAMLTREELIERCESVMAAYGRERARSGELVERLKVLHAEQVDALELKRRYQLLQEAHEEQARLYGDPDGQAEKMVQMRATVKTQEEIIRNLEALLAQTVQKVKPRSQDPGTRISTAAEASEQLDAAQAAATTAAASGVGSPADSDLRSQLAAAEQRVRDLDTELAVREAADREAAQRMRQMEAELEALRQHTVTEFPAAPAPDKPERSATRTLRQSGTDADREGAGEGKGEDALQAPPDGDQPDPQGRAASQQGRETPKPEEQEEQTPTRQQEAAEEQLQTPPDDDQPDPQGRAASRQGRETPKQKEQEEQTPTQQRDAAEGQLQQQQQKEDDVVLLPGQPRHPGGRAEVDGDDAQAQQEPQQDQQLEPQQEQPPAAEQPPSEASGREAGPENVEGERASPEEQVRQLQERVQELEGELEAARARIMELSEAEESTKTVTEEAASKLQEEVGKMQQEVMTLTEEKTAAVLRAEFSEGAAEAAQTELVEVTRRYAREIAALKARLAEKEAAMMGGFGGLESLTSREDPPFPAFPLPPPGPSVPEAAKPARTPPAMNGGSRGGGSTFSGSGQGDGGGSVVATSRSPRAPPDPRVSPVLPRVASTESAGRMGSRQSSSRGQLRTQSLTPEQEAPPQPMGALPPLATAMPAPGQALSPEQGQEATTGSGGDAPEVADGASADGNADGGGGIFGWMKSRRGRVGDKAKSRKGLGSEGGSPTRTT